MKHYFAIFTVVLGMLLVGCRSDIDLNNIDPKAEVEMGLALPVGTLNATIGDFFGKSQGNFYVDTMDNKGVITWKDTFKIARNFHQIDLAKYISEKELNLKVYEKIPGEVIGDNKKVTGNGMPIILDFDLPLKLTGINHKDSLEKERLDSALIDMSSFASTIKTNNLPLEWEWIDQVTLDLGDRINRPEGNTMVVYDKNTHSYGYGQRILTDVDRFSINLMKDKTKVGEVIDSCNFKIHFTFTIPAGTTVEIPKDAGFDYKLEVQFMTYKAIWGKFIRSKDMYDEDTVDLKKSWGSLEFISKSNVPFADPKINMGIVTQVAGAMKVYGEYLYAQDANNVKHYATFKRGNEVFTDCPRQFEAGEYLDPITSTIGDSTTNTIINFDKDERRGHLDQLFQNMPQLLGYKFEMDFNYQMTPQIRITPNTSVRIEAECILPLIFNEGLHIEYNDTIKDINLSKYSLDSLLAEVKVIDTLKASNVNLLLHAKNGIPLDIKAYMRCYDADGTMIMDPSDPTKPFLLFPNDTVTFVAPQYVRESGTWIPKTPGETNIWANLTKEELDLFSYIKSIRYFAWIDDSSLQEAYSKGLENISITNDQKLSVKIGLSAQAEAILDFSKTDK